MKKITKEKADIAYAKGKPLMPDYEYDEKYGANADSKVLVNKHDTVKLPRPMASLQKISVLDDLYNFSPTLILAWSKKNKVDTFVSLYKYDGLAIQIEYKDGKLFRAATRGDGVTGQDVTSNVLKAENVKKTLNSDVRFLYAEVVIRKSIFEKHLRKSDKNKDGYENTRNGAVGALTKVNSKNAKYLTVLYYDAEMKSDDGRTGFRTYAQRMKLLEMLGFKDVEYQVINIGEFESHYKKMQKLRDTLDFDIDGIVLVADDVSSHARLGRDSDDNPNYKQAIKFPPEVKEGKLVKINWSLGKTGHITPVAQIEPLKIGGVTVTRATLHNMDFLEAMWSKKKPRAGDVLNISRRGDVIPAVEKVVKTGNGDLIKMLAKCPKCKEKELYRDGPFLMCGNDSCDAKKLGDIQSWIFNIKGWFDFKGIGPEAVSDIFESGLATTVDDLYKIDAKDLILTLDGFKKKKAENTLLFQKAEFRKLPLHVFLGSLNIPTIGKRVFENVTAEYELDELFDMVDSNDQKTLCSIEGISSTRAELIVKGLKKKRPLIKKLLKFIEIVEEEEVEPSSTKLDGISFCFTGTLSQPRKHFESLVTDNGGELKSVSKALTYLVMGADAGGKADKAKKSGVKILNEKQFLEMVK